MTGTIRITATATRPAAASTKAGLKSMPIETKNTPAKTSRSGPSSLETWWLMSDSPMSSPARNAPERQRQPEQLADVGRAQGDRDDGQDEHLAAAQQRDALEQPRQHVQAQRQQERQEEQRLARGDRDVDASGRRPATSAVSSTTSTTVERSWSTVQPSAMWPCCESSSPRSPRILAITVLDDWLMKAPKNSASMRREAERQRDQVARSRPTRRPGPRRRRMRSRRTRMQVADRQLEADGEQQEDEADVGERGDRVRVGDRPGRVRPDEHAGRDVAQDGRLPEADGNGRTDRGDDQRKGERYQKSGVGHGLLGSRRAGTCAGAGDQS